MLSFQNKTSDCGWNRCFFFLAFVGSGFSDHGSKGVPHE